MTELIFATNNSHKAAEINSMLGKNFKIITLAEAGIDIDIEEPFPTLVENAIEKANVIYKLTKRSCFGEDTGLEIDALDGRPGVKSARYAGDQRSSSDNINLVLEQLQNIKNRTAQFRTVIALMTGQQLHTFEGICKGTIIASLKGASGFGYDPIFIPTGSKKTFAEMDMNEKNHFSHRKKAVDKLIEYLSSSVENK